MLRLGVALGVGELLTGELRAASLDNAVDVLRELDLFVEHLADTPSAFGFDTVSNLGAGPVVLEFVRFAFDAPRPEVNGSKRYGSRQGPPQRARRSGHPSGDASEKAAHNCTGGV